MLTQAINAPCSSVFSTLIVCTDNWSSVAPHCSHTEESLKGERERERADLYTTHLSRYCHTGHSANSNCPPVTLSSRSVAFYAHKAILPSFHYLWLHTFGNVYFAVIEEQIVTLRGNLSLYRIALCYLALLTHILASHYSQNALLSVDMGHVLCFL